jgi:hypothetical protein
MPGTLEVPGIYIIKTKIYFENDDKIKYALVLVILIFSSNAYAQKSSSYKAQKGAVRLGAFYAYNTNLSADNIKLDRGIGYTIDYAHYNFAAGLNMEYFLLKNFTLNSGISYSSKDFEGLFFCNSCNFAGPGPKLEKMNLQFLQVPITAKYYPYLHKISVFIQFGLLNQIMIDKPTGINGVLNLETKTYALSGIIGPGIGYHFSSGFAVQFAVKYIKGFSGIFKDADYSYQVLGYQLSLIKKL